jgi:hypothetical protein
MRPTSPGRWRGRCPYGAQPPYQTVPYQTVPYQTVPYQTVPYQTADSGTAASTTACMADTELDTARIWPMRFAGTGLQK